MRRIELTKGKHALVDDEDYELLTRWKWYAHNPADGLWYALRNSRVCEGPPRRTIRMHSVVLGRPWVDHVDGNGLNNQRTNLRACSHAQNQANSRGRGSTSKYRGVYWHKKGRKWQACITVKNKTLHLAWCDEEKEAARAYNEAALRYFGGFARVNDI